MTVTTRLDVQVKCESPGCGRSFPYTHAASILFVRERAEANGWTYKGFSDYCPEHS